VAIQTAGEILGEVTVSGEVSGEIATVQDTTQGEIQSSGKVTGGHRCPVHRTITMPVIVTIEGAGKVSNEIASKGACLIQHVGPIKVKSAGEDAYPGPGGTPGH
jgi:hypothetical protein